MNVSTYVSIVSMQRLLP